jgi:hypothetical protein
MKDLPAIRQHNDIAAHLSEEDFAQRDAVTVIPPITMKHEHRRSCCRKLSLVHMINFPWIEGNPVRVPPPSTAHPTQLASRSCPGRAAEATRTP